jgi:protocatechuate 3,4-dioxygenase beta subunit
MGNSGMRPRHIHFKVAHEDAGKVTTQMYFEGDPLIEDDIVMRDTPEELRHLLITSPAEDPETGLPLHRFDIALG